MKTAEELKQNIDTIKKQIADLKYEKAKLQFQLEEIEPPIYIDHRTTSLYRPLLCMWSIQ